MRRYLPKLDKDALRQFMCALLPGAEKRFNVTGQEVVALTDVSIPLSVRLTAQGLKPLDHVGNALYCNPYLFSGLAAYEKVDLSQRQYPVNLYYPDGEYDTVTVTWDSSLVVDSIIVPAGISTTYDFVDLSSDARVTEDVATATMARRYRSYSVDTAQFSQFEEFRAHMRSLSDRYVKLVIK